MIWGIHYYITELKTEIDIIPRSCFTQKNIAQMISKHLGLKKI